jgi:hypothetical protein
LDVVTRQDVGIQANHSRNTLAGSKSTGTARRRLFNMPKPPAGTAVEAGFTRNSIRVDDVHFEFAALSPTVPLENGFGKRDLSFTDDGNILCPARN